MVSFQDLKKLLAAIIFRGGGGGRGREFVAGASASLCNTIRLNGRATRQLLPMEQTAIAH